MKLSKNLGRVATTLLATAMLASVSAVPAFAETGVTGTGETEIDEITIEKVLYLPTGTTVPTLSYDFNIVADQTATGTFNGKKDDVPMVSLNVKPGKGGGNAVATASFNGEDQATVLNGSDGQPTGVSYVTKEVTLSLDSLTGFDDAGVYKYDITETRTGDVAEGVTATNGALDLYVYVNREGENNYVITGAVVTEDGNPDVKTDTIKNYYDVTPDPDGGDPTANKGSLSIAKTVTGKMGDYEEDFQFTIQGIADGTYNIAYTGDNVDSTRDTTVTVSDSKATLPVQHGEKVTIYGIPKAENVNVSENAETLAAEGYTVTETKVDGESKTASSSVSVNVEPSEETATAFTNNREAVSPTGIVMNVAPYVLLVVIAAAGCFVFLRKRRED